MHTITLVCTRHKESQYCNSDGLFQIIELIKPEVIFEELSQSNFAQFYQGTRRNLETNAIKMYLKDHSIEHIPVDTYLLPDSYEDNADRMYDRITSSSFNLRTLIDKQYQAGNERGFEYLNSDENDTLFEEMNILTENILNKINDENLFGIRRLEKKVIESREQTMLDNIYEYSQKNPYKKALFFIGSGHRRSIIYLIGKYQVQNELKINWILDGSE